MMPKLRYSLIWYSRAIGFLQLPAVVREGAVRVRHAVRIFAFLDCLAAAVHRIHEFARQALTHGVLAALAGGFDQPANGKGLLALGTDFNRNLIGRTTNAARAHFNRRTNVVERGME